VQFYFFILGLFIGSFLGVVIDRLPYNKSILIGRSQCNSCRHKLGLLDLIPVLSFILLKGKCRYCKAKLSLFYPVIELLTAFLFALIFFNIVTPLTLVNLKFIFYLLYLLLMVSSFIVIFFIDLKNGIIPDKILIFDTVISLVWLSISPLSIIINRLLSGFGSIAFFIAVSYIFYLVTKKEGMGGGDVKMSFVLGLFLGFPAIVFSLYLAFILGTIFAIFLLIFRKKTFKGSLPFGPFLIMGTLLSLFFQNQLYAFLLKFIQF
jgi:leader peptidase (prepilin peptidase)/N-methyltransferase